MVDDAIQESRIFRENEEKEGKGRTNSGERRESSGWKGGNEERGRSGWRIQEMSSLKNPGEMGRAKQARIELAIVQEQHGVRFPNREGPWGRRPRALGRRRKCKRGKLRDKNILLE